MKFKKFSVLILMLIFAIGVTGCMNNSNKKMEEMKQYAEEKYGKEFTVEYFYAAHDSTYNDVLTLSDGEVLFNVLCTDEDGLIRDDYAEMIIFKKYGEYLVQTNNITDKNIEIYSAILLINRGISNYEYVSNTDVKAIIEDSEVLKSIVVIRVPDFENIDKTSLFDIYKTILADNPKVIDFNVIACDEIHSELEKSLTNMGIHYNNNWKEYSEIKNYIHIKDKDIKSAEFLISEVK